MAKQEKARFDARLSKEQKQFFEKAALIWRLQQLNRLYYFNSPGAGERNHCGK